MQEKAGSYINLPFLKVFSVFSLLKVKAFSGKGTLERSFSISVVLSSSMIVEDKLVVVFGEGGVFSRVNK
jgi:hypothetical protein